MAYIGRGIDNISNASLLDDITFTNSAGPYNLTKGSAAFTPISVQALVISVDGVIQDPSSYTISAATITFGVSMASTLTNDFIVHNGVGLVTEPSDGSVTAAKLATDAVETAKIKDLNVTAGKLAATQDLSTKTITLPASVSGLGTGIDVTSQITGVVPTANLGSGSASSSTYLAGDQTYKEIVATDIAWQAVTTGTTLTAVAGRGYPINTTSNVCTVTLPVSASVGDQIIFTDYVRNWNTNALTINQNSLNFQGNSSVNPVYDTDGESVHIVYMDATQGWIPLYDGAVSYETNPWTGTVDYLVIAGGGAGGAGISSSSYGGGGGGAGGYRASWNSEASGGGGSSETQETQTQGTTYTITVGAGGTGPAVGAVNADDAEDSSFIGTGISITSAGGGGGACRNNNNNNGYNGGSGGGDCTSSTVGPGTGTTNQGYAGGNENGSRGEGAGGGAGAVGGDASGDTGGTGGNGVVSTITGASLTKAGGGGGSGHTEAPGGSGGGGAGGDRGGGGVAGTVNTGSGGGASGEADAGYAPGVAGANGGAGVVIVRMTDGDYSSSTGSPTVATGVDGTDTVLTFTGDGTYVTIS